MTCCERFSVSCRSESRFECTQADSTISANRPRSQKCVRARVLICRHEDEIWMIQMKAFLSLPESWGQEREAGQWCSESKLGDGRGSNVAIPIRVSFFYGRSSCCLWEDELGKIHDIQQGEGGEQGDALMPMLFSLGLHEALVSVATDS